MRHLFPTPTSFSFHPVPRSTHPTLTLTPKISFRFFIPFSYVIYRREVLGEYHPNYLTSLHNLGGLYEYQGRYAEAEVKFQECLSRRILVLGEFHPSTLTALSSLAGCYVSQENYEEATRKYQECLTKRSRSLGTKHPSTLMTIYNLAKLAEKCGKLGWFL